jgi:hypothetical protein
MLPRLNFFLFLYILIIGLSSDVNSDSFQFNTYNNHGMVGLINTPTARFHEEGSHGFSFYYGTPDQKIHITSSPYDWLEASVFYSNIKENPVDCNFQNCRKDKGFNFKIRLKEEGLLPALAIGINDIGGTGLYSSEYIVGSYGIDKLDMHFGLGWGTLNGTSRFKNPLGYIYDGFNERPELENVQGGQFAPKTYFSGETSTPFYGISYALHPKLLLKAEYDPILTERYDIPYDDPKSRITYGFDYLINDNINIGIAAERDNYISFRFAIKRSLKAKQFNYSKPKKTQNESAETTLIRNLQANGLGVNKIVENADSIGIEISQFTHPSISLIEEIIMTAKGESGIEKDIKVNYKIGGLQAETEFDQAFINRSRSIYERQEGADRLIQNTRLTVRPFIAAREDFIKLSVLLQNDGEYVIRDNFFFSYNLKYSIWDNFEDLTYPATEVYPAEVRSDVKEYLKNFDEGITIGRAQFDYHISPKENNHVMVTAGILEEMFSGYGFEYLHFEHDKDYAYGFEVFDVVKRDYRGRFGTRDYKNTVGSVNFYYRNQKILPLDVKVSYGEYLAGDKGLTFDLSRTYSNGTSFGVFATFSDVTREEYGEGSFDKGIYFNIPIGDSIGSYTWRPLTKDPGAKLNRKHTLYDLLVKFRPYYDIY